MDFIEISAKEIYTQILTNLENDVREPLYPGDERRIFAEALIQVIVSVYNSINDACRQKMLRYARKEVLDALGENNLTTRIPAGAATTTLKFILKEPFRDDITIPHGTRVTGDFNIYFHTKKEEIIKAGETFVEVLAEAEEPGSAANNIPAGEINKIVDLSSAALIDAVLNITPTNGGSDEENDESYRERIRIADATFSTAGPDNAYRYYALAADSRISDAYISSPIPGVVLITPICHGGEIPDNNLLDKVLQSCADPKVKPLTDYVQVQAPNIHLYDIDIIYYTNAKDELKCTETIESENGAIDRYVEWQGSTLNNDINPDYLRKLILSPDWSDDVVGAERIIINSPQYTELNPTTVAKFSGDLIVSHIVRG